jgi:hypothetical protein
MVKDADADDDNRGMDDDDGTDDSASGARDIVVSDRALS